MQVKAPGGSLRKHYMQSLLSCRHLEFKGAGAQQAQHWTCEKVPHHFLINKWRPTAELLSHTLVQRFCKAAMVTAQDLDLLHPPQEREARKHKLKRLITSPKSYFIDVKCPSSGCTTITTIFSHSQASVRCPRCGAALCVATGGKARLAEGCAYRRKSG